MLKSVYLLCSESGAVDEQSNRLSFFNVVEELIIAKKKESDVGKPSRGVQLRIVSVWMRTDEGQPGQMFEAQFVARFPNAPAPELNEIVFSEVQFALKTLFHRIIVSNLTMPGFFGPGILWIECRVRRVGEEQWLGRQEYPIHLEDGEKTLPNGQTE